MELKIKKGGMEELDISEPVSPTGQYFSIPPAVCITAVFEFDNPIDDSDFATRLFDTFSRINPRFTSVMVEGENGEKRWKRVELKVEDHIKVPRFPDGLPLESYDDYFSDYLSGIGIEPFPDTRPLWELHLFKYPSSNASGTAIFKIHHALGDGYSLMGVVLSCLHRAEDPSVPLTFPKFRLSPKSDTGIKSLISRVPLVLTALKNTVRDLAVSVLKSNFLEDDQSPIRSGEEGVEFKPIDVTTLTFSLDQIKQIKSSLGVTINDVITGVVFLGTRLYMEATSSKSGNARTTSLVLLNTRLIDGYRSVDDMLNNSKAQNLWGNQFGFIQVSVPKLNQSDDQFLNPLIFVYEAHDIISQKRNSWGIYLTGMLLESIRRYRGTPAAAKYLYRTQKNASMGLTNMVGPVDRMSIGDQTLKGFYSMVFNVPQSCKVTIMSYMNMLRMAIGTQKGVIDHLKYNRCIQEAYDMILKAALNSN